MNHFYFLLLTLEIESPCRNVLRILPVPLCATDCPVFKVKAKMNIFEPSNVINRSKSFTTKRFQRLVFQKLEKDLILLQNKLAFMYLDFLVKCPLCRGKVRVELGMAVSV